MFYPAANRETLVGGQYQRLPSGKRRGGYHLEPERAVGAGHLRAARAGARLYDPVGGQWLLTPEEKDTAWRASEEARRSAEAALRESDSARQAAEAARQAAGCGERKAAGTGAKADRWAVTRRKRIYRNHRLRPRHWRRGLCPVAAPRPRRGPGAGKGETRWSLKAPKSLPAVRHPTAPEDTRPAVEYDDPNIEYPASDGEPMTESDLQFTPLTVTVIVLRIWFAQRSDVYVAGDLLCITRCTTTKCGGGRTFS